MVKKCNVWKVIGIITLIICFLLLIVINNQANEIREWQSINNDALDLVHEWCEYSNDLIEFSNAKVYDDVNLQYNLC